MSVRLLPALCLAALAAAAVWPAAADAGRYTVVACDALFRGFPDAVFERSNAGDYTFSRDCDRPAGAGSLQIKNITGAPRGHSAAIRFLAPAGARLVGAALEANLRSDEGHRARVALLNSAGQEAGRIATGGDGPGGFQTYRREEPSGRAGLQAILVCERDPRCAQSDRARAWIRALRMTLEDRVAPRVKATGELLAGGWLRGQRGLSLELTDAGSGVESVEVRSGGRKMAPTRSFACKRIGGTALVKSVQPCAPSRSLSSSHDTAARPFVNGANPLQVCVRDYGRGAHRTCIERRVLVDNLAPAGYLRQPRRGDPELIAAKLADEHSGLAGARIAYRPAAGGEWRELETRLGGDGLATARVDSSAEPPGRYRFAVRATDRAGNELHTSHGRDGSDLVLSFPLRERSRLSYRLRPSGSPIRYGTRTLLAGRLTGGGNRGLRRGVGGERLEVVERMAPGASSPLRTRPVRTDGRGRFRVRLAAGPSRTVLVRFTGSRRYLPATGARRRFAVLGRSTLTVERRRVRAGESLAFRGRVGTRGAVVPAGGKIVELQVRERGRGRFRTVRQALHTDGAGRLRTTYSFDRLYPRRARFEFRLRVTPQAGWPYRAPAHSRPRPVTVIPR